MVISALGEDQPHSVHVAQSAKVRVSEACRDSQGRGYVYLRGIEGCWVFSDDGCWELSDVFLPGEL